MMQAWAKALEDIVEAVKKRFEHNEQHIIHMQHVLSLHADEIIKLREANEQLKNQLRDLTDTKVEEIILDKEQGG